MKTSKRIVSFVLSAIMVVTTFLAVGPVFTIEASAIALGGISQEHVVSDYAAKYAQYQQRFFEGAETNWPTDIVIPGLRNADDYTPQGMTYWAAKEWILISAYDAHEAENYVKKNSVIYALDIKTGDFVALFKVFNNNGTVNASHGGGIAASEYNFYYADSGSNISYWPLSVMDVPVGTVKNVYIRDSINCSGELNGAATSYCCYDEGVLWTGNFYLDNDNYNYGQPANASYNSMLFGYQLRGDSSALEWDYLCADDHPITITNYTNSSHSGTQKAYFTAEKNYLRLRFGMRYGNGGTVKYSNIKIYEVGNSGTNLFNFANWASGNGNGVNGGSISVDTSGQVISMTASSNDVYSNPWNGVSGSGAVKVTAGKKYCLQYNYQVSGVSTAQLEPFVFWDDDTTDNGESANYCPAFKTAANVLTMSKDDAVMTYSLSSDSNGVDIVGSIKKDRSTSEGGASIGEMAPKFATAVLDVGRKYKISYTATKDSDIYIFAPNGKHSNVKQSSATKITDNGNGTYKYEMEFTAGLAPAGADSAWPTTQSTDTAYSGLYTLRFDQDSITASRDFSITDLKIEHCHEGEHDDSMRGTDCEGNPTHCIAFDNSLDKIQYSMVDKGRIYISRSWSRKQGSTHTRELDIASIDIYAPGTKPLTINGVSRVCHFVDTKDSTFKKYGGTGNGVSGQEKMLYMGEALCIIDDYLYMFTEGAAYNYRAKDSSSVCPEPIDVIWKIDQLALVGATRTVTADIEASHYERVNGLSDFDKDAEYIIVFESAIKDRVTQKNILYLLDSFGGYAGSKLPKHDNPTKDLTADSMGTIGYKITSYSTDGDKLYIDDTDDENKSIRWKITHSGNGSALRLENMDSYYGQNKYLNFGSRVIAMSTGNSTDITLNFLSLSYDSQTNKFYICSTNGGSTSYLWCNDGSDPNNTYISAYTDHYKKSSTNVYAGCEEVAGTFHTDGSYKYGENGGNVTGAAVNTALERFAIYKRVPDPHAFTGESQVYTDLKAEIQADGTLNLNLETYATASLHYKTLSAKRPTDYIFVLDKSGSTDAKDGTGYERWDDTLSMATIAGNKSHSVFSFDSAGKVRTYDISSDVYYMTSDGKLRLIYGAVKDISKGSLGKRTQAFWAYYKDDNGLCYVFHRDNDATSFSIDSGITWSQFVSNVDNSKNNTLQIESNDKEARSEATLWKGPHYRSGQSVTNLRQMQNLATQLTYDIAADAAANGLDHRIALCRVGYKPGEGNSDTTTAFYKAGSTSPTALTVTSGFSSSQDFSNVFNSTSQFGTLRTAINSMVTGGHSHFDYAMKTMVPKMVSASGEDYSYNGDRSLCVIMITDGGLCSVEDNLTIAGSGTSDVYGSTIMGAKDIKELGGQVHTIRVGHEDISDWDEDHNLSCISSDYISAQSGTNTGEPSPWDVDFSHAFSTSSFDYSSAASTVMAEVNEGRKYALAKLDANAILREQLDESSFSFEKVTQNDITIGTQAAYYDAIGRLTFGETQADSSITANISQANSGLITITGFDYSKNYISSNTAKNGTAKKLVVTIKNVEFADDVVNMDSVDKPIVDVPVSIADNTGIYMKNGDKHRSFPEDRITIPQYTYVFDYGLGMFDTDVNGTLMSVGTTMSPIPMKNGKLDYKTSAESGKTELKFSQDNQNMYYSIEKGETSMRRYFVLIQRPNGEYDWFAINLVPASNVYYEESEFTVPASTSVSKWTSMGTEKLEYQSISLWDDVYGYDENYLTCETKYSNDTYLTSKVSADNPRSTTVTTTFTGDTFDLYSVCAENTGVQVVAIRDTSGTLVKSYVVDTFYKDTVNNFGTLYQVPIAHFEGDWGTYKVEVTSAWLPSLSGALKSQSVSSQLIDENGIISYTNDFTNEKESVILTELGFEELIGEDVEFVWFNEDSVLNGGEGPFAVEEGSFTTQATLTELVNYIDGFRVYNALQKKDTGVYKLQERGPEYYNIINHLTSTNVATQGFAYFISDAGEGSVDEKTIDFTAYNANGRPKNEIYLTSEGNQYMRQGALAFSIHNWTPDSSLMISARAAAGTPQLRVNDKYYTISTTMDMYYDITDAVTVIDNSDGSKTANVIIGNTDTGSSLLALGYIRVTDPASVPTLQTFSDESAIIEILDMPMEEFDFTAPRVPSSDDTGAVPPAPPVVDDDSDVGGNDENDDIVPPSDDNNEPEEPAEDGFFAKVESFFVKIFNFFKNIFNKVYSFFEF